MIKLRVLFFCSLEPGNPECETAESFCKRIYSDNNTALEDKISIVDSVIEVSERELHDSFLLWKDKIHAAITNGSIDQIKYELKDFFKTVFTDDSNPEGYYPLVYDFNDLPLPKALVLWPELIDKICEDIEHFIKTIQDIRYQILTGDISTEAIDKPQAVRNERVQWHGTTTGFFCLLQELEDHKLIDKGLRPTISQGFLDKNGNPMPGDKTSYLAQAKPASLSPTIRGRIEKIVENKDTDLI